MGGFERPEFRANVGLIDEIYRQYLDNPESVSPAWRDFFAENEPEGYEDPSAAEATAPPTPQEAPPAREPAPKPEAKPEAKPKAEAKPKPKAPEPEANLVPLRGAAARIVEAMEASREGPTARSLRRV